MTQTMLTPAILNAYRAAYLIERDGRPGQHIEAHAAGLAAAFAAADLPIATAHAAVVESTRLQRLFSDLQGQHKALADDHARTHDTLSEMFERYKALHATYDRDDITLGKDVAAEVWEAIRSNSSPTVMPESAPGMVTMHGGQSGVILWELDGKPYAVREIMRIMRREIERAALSSKTSVPGNDAGVREALGKTTASLVAAISLLKRGGKKAAPSNTMFDMMVADYEKAVDQARTALSPLAGSAGDDETGVRKGPPWTEELVATARINAIEEQMRQHGGVDAYDLEWMVQGVKAGIRAGAARPTMRLATQPPKAETPAGVGELADAMQTILSGRDRWGDARFAYPDDRHVYFTLGEVRRLASAYEALSLAPAARTGDGVETLHDIATDALEILPLVSETLEGFRGEGDEVLDDLISRFRTTLTAAPAANGEGGQ